MKVLLITGAFPPMQAGEATNAVYLARHLADRGVDVHVLTTEGADAGKHPGVTVHSTMRTWSWPEAFRFKRVLEQLRPDAVYLLYLGWIYKYEFMITFAPTISKRLFPNVPFVTRFENAMAADARYTSALSRLVRKGVATAIGGGDVNYSYGTLLRDSDRVIVLSDYHRTLLADIHPRVNDKCVLIPPPANMRMTANDATSRARGRDMLGVRPDEFLLAYIGYVHSGKGLESLLDALRQLSATRRNVRLAIIGGAIDAGSKNPSSYLDEIRQYSTRLGIDELVKWTGSYSWDEEDASLYLRAADACVLPFTKGVHMNNSSFASAIAHGLPTITTEPDVRDAPIRDGENALLCPPGRVDAIAAAIARLMDERDLREKLRTGASQLAREWFSWDSAAQRTLATFEPPARRPTSAIAP